MIEPNPHVALNNAREDERSYDPDAFRGKAPFPRVALPRRWTEPPDPVVVELLKDVMFLHSDPDSPDYNMCDQEKCQWCETAQGVLDRKKQ